MRSASPSILVLGARGMVGHTVFSFLSEKFPDTTFGTHRRKLHNQPRIFKLSVRTFKKDFVLISTRMKKIDFIINCIAQLPAPNSEDNMFNANTKLPKLLAKKYATTETKIIHISSDAVFDPSVGTVDETALTNAEDQYGISKARGEVIQKNILNIRTSLIGFDKIEKRGLLEWIKNSSTKTLQGYTNQSWAGCTSYQFAQLCHFLVTQKNFVATRLQTPVLHFVPLQATKYEIVHTTCTILNLPKNVKKVESKIITRTLVTRYKKLIAIELKSELSAAVRQAYEFEV